ncbi:MAG: hypothetical protein QMD82_03520 [bacterium]|nr:hypothetical protein [bacterium]
MWLCLRLRSICYHKLQIPGNLIIRKSTVIDFEIIKKGFEGFNEVYPSLEPKERRALARLFIKEVKILNNKVDIEFLEFPEFAHQNPVQILKEPSIRGGIFMAV